MRHRTVITTATAVILALGATTASAAGTGPASGGSAGKKPAQCSPDRPDSKLDNALRNVKIALGANGGRLTDRIVAAFAKDMGMSTAEARKMLDSFFHDGRSGGGKPGDPAGKGGTSGKGGGKPGDPGGTPGKGGAKPGDPGGTSGKGGKTGPAAVFTAAELAKALGIPKDKAQIALNALQKLAVGPKGTIDENSAAFAAVAAGAGVSPQQLTKAIFVLKMAAGKGTDRKPVPCKPAPGKGNGDGKDKSGATGVDKGEPAGRN